MQRNTLLTLFATAVFGLVTAGPANAADNTFTWKGGAGTGSQQTQWDYQVSGAYVNWDWDGGASSPTELPNSGDTVVIPDVTHDPAISSAEAFTTLTINSGGKLTITGTNTVTISGSSHTFSGDLVLQDSGSIVKFTGGTITASGSSTTGIKGENNGAKIQIEGGDTLTSTMLIQGHMAIETNGGTGAGKLDNRGVVLANAINGTLQLGSNLLLADTGGGVRWKAGTDSGAILLFKNAHTGANKLDGDFAVANCATLTFDGAIIETNGAFDTGAAAGFVDVENSGEFRYECDAFGGCTVIDTDQTYGGC